MAFALLLVACEADPDDPDAVADNGVVNVVSAFTGDEADAFRESFAAFEEETGITVDYEPTADFEVLLPTRVEAGDPPDIALFPQTGLLMGSPAYIPPERLPEEFYQARKKLGDEAGNLPKGVIGPIMLDAAVMPTENFLE
jgi:ABC-type glycerol-3-phosphate transport system substrate-binding protein